MAQSSAKRVSYDLRPAKQSERKMIVDLLKLAGDCGHEIRTYRYVGMGANRFYDYLMMHKYLGIKNMVSLEYDENMFKRAEFNVPYRFIEVHPSSVAEFIANDKYSEKSIYWFDYDSGIGPEMLQDIMSLSTKLSIGEFLFVTTTGSPPRALNRLNDADRLTYLEESLADVAHGLKQSDMQNSVFPATVHKILLAAFKNAFSHHADAAFFPFLQIRYADGVPMVTVGGGLFPRSGIREYKSKIAKALPFLKPRARVSKLYEIKSLNLTERERSLFDRAVTSSEPNSLERKQIRKLGFNGDQVKKYKELIRYLPRYVETLV